MARDREVLDLYQEGINAGGTRAGWLPSEFAECRESERGRFDDEEVIPTRSQMAAAKVKMGRRMELMHTIATIASIKGDRK